MLKETKHSAIFLAVLVAVAGAVYVAPRIETWTAPKWAPHYEPAAPTGRVTSAPAWMLAPSNDRELRAVRDELQSLRRTQEEIRSAQRREESDRLIRDLTR